MEWSYPQDWVGFATQILYQRQGGPSYLFGERRMVGWWYYYPVALLYKLPLAFGFLLLARVLSWGQAKKKSWMLLVMVLAFLVVAMLGSKRNYGVRYLLPVATPALVWISALAEGCRRSRWMALGGVSALAVSMALTHPHELSYFNSLAGGSIGGRKILADSNLDWGQGARSLARLQRTEPAFRDLTLFYFGDTDPGYYGVEGRRDPF